MSLALIPLTQVARKPQGQPHSAWLVTLLSANFLGPNTIATPTPAEGATAAAALVASQQLAQTCQGRVPSGSLSCAAVVHGYQMSCWDIECVCRCMTSLAMDRAGYLWGLNRCGTLLCGNECARSPAACMACAEQRCPAELPPA